MNQAQSPTAASTANSSNPSQGSGQASAAPMPAGDSPISQADQSGLLSVVLSQLDDDQAQDIVTIPLAGKSSMADYMIIASGRSTRQVASMAQKLAEQVKKEGFGSSQIEGLPAADWVLIDAGDIVVHLFRPEVRSFYNLERMWAFGDAPPVGDVPPASGTV